MVEKPVGTTLVDLVRLRALQQPDRPAFTFLAEEQDITFTYADLDRKARTLGAALQQISQPGERALLLYPPGDAYLVAFFGCLYAGILAVPAYPPRLNGSLDRLQAIVQDAQATLALTTESIRSKVEHRFSDTPGLQGLKWMDTESVSAELIDHWKELELSAEHLAFLQYTSGSTSTPKGVMLSHGNLLHNLDFIQESFATTEESETVIWLPPYHDMGLIGGILQPLYAGFHTTLMSPFAFMQRPLQWLEEITRKQARVSGGPNFAYDLCVQKITEEQKAGLDLSTWDVAFTGAEPIRKETLDRFVEAFASCGFRREAFYPCYGLAEATLFVTGGFQKELPVVQAFDADALEQNRVQIVSEEQSGARLLVSSGQPRMTKQQVEIVDPQTGARCAGEQVGEIWVAGPSVAQGYWKREEQTRETFGARLTTGEGPFLRTGDLGFVRDGELYVTGRLKDLIIIRGRNFYPQDIEFTMQESHVALRPGCGAAFTVDVDGEERLVVVQEIERQHRKADLDEVVASIRQAVSEEHQLPLHAVVLIRPATAPLTSSGKIQRHACRERYLTGTLDVMKMHIQDGSSLVAGDELEANAGQDGAHLQKTHLQEILLEQMLDMTPTERLAAVERHLQAKAADILRMDRAKVDLHKPLGAFGLDSLMAVELKDALEESLGVLLPLVTFLEGPSLAQVAAEVVAQIEAQLATEGQRAQVAATTQESIANEQFLATTQATDAPLSYGQRALWFMQRLAPESSAYNIAHAVRIPGALQVDALRSALTKVVQRHSQLRTVFPTRDEQPIQVVQERFELPFDVQDASACDEATLRERLTQLANTPFDLATGPLLRTYLFSRSNDEHVLLLTVHHIIVDFWSLGVFLHELQQFYAAEVHGNAAETVAPSATYADHIAWQSELVNGTEGQSLLSYWQEQLSGELPILNLPTDRPRPPVQTYHGATRSFTLNAELTARLKEMAQAAGVTLYMAMLSLYQVLLYRYTGQEDIIVGSPTAGRSRAAYRELIGYFVNPVALRANFAGEQTFTEFLAQVRQTVLGALQHQEYPFPLLVEKIQPKRDPSYPPIFQTMFVLQKSHLLDDQGLTAFALSEEGAKLQAGDLLLESMSLEQRAAQFDLTLSMAEVNGEIVASFEYNCDLFDGTTIERMSEHFQTLADGLLANPNGRLADAPLLSNEERDLLLYGWNDTATDVFLDECLHQKFEQQVAKTPDLIAVVYGEEQVTYRELNERANRLAHHLREQGIGSDVTVGLCVERSVEMIVGLLGILKAGGAYVPLDPVNPPERLRLIMEDSQAPVLLTQKKFADAVTGHKAQTVYLDAEEAFWQSDATHNLNVDITADNLAYIIYTSGTTGTPKGVCVPHRGVLNVLYDTERRRALVPGDGCIAFSSFGFDASVYEMFGSLLFGGRLHPVPEALRTDIPAFFRWLEASDIQIAYLPAFLLQDFIHRLRKGTSQFNLRRIFVGVEPLSEPMLAEICRLQPNALMLNAYGPTEASIVATVYEVSGESTEVRNAPIGRPVDNMHAYVLDAHMQPVPIGVPGELYVGGVGVVRGYLKRPDLTEEKFIPSPFVTGERLYRTGDLVRYNTAGQIQFIGRIDQQVKLRGFRMELGEIKFAIAEHPDVKDVVVLAREDQRGEKRLVAYVIPGASAVHTLTADALRDRLQAHLPPYMVPSAFVLLDAFPLNANGKLDVRELPEPSYTCESSFVAARTPVEELLVGIWADVMSLEQVGVQDDFFALGGHSLLATQVISRINSAFGLEVPLAKLFEFPTVAGLAAFLEKEQAVQSERLQASQIVPVSRGKHVPLSFAQERMWFFEQFQSGTATYNMPGAVRMRGHLDVQALERSLQAIWRRHEALRMNIAVVDGQAVATLNEVHELVLLVRDLRELPDGAEAGRESIREAEMQRLSREEAEKSFDLTTDALVRTTLLQLSDEEHVLLLTMHHIVADGWSIGVFIREMAALYAAFLEGDDAPKLPALDVQYADFAHWQREWLQGDVLDAQLEYWKQQLHGDLPVLHLPTDRPRPTVQTFNGASVPVELGESLTEALKRLSQREGVTLFMTLLSSFKTLLYRYSGQEDILIGSPIAGRNHEEIEHLIGFFVNTLVLRTELSGDLSFRDLLGRVRQVALEAYAHQDVPFEKLVEELQPNRSMTHSPLFQVMFALNNAPISALDLPGLSISPWNVSNGTAKFDLTISMSEEDGGLAGTLEYNTDLFDHDTILRMVEHFKQLLLSIVAAPERTIAELPLLPPTELHQVLVAFNDTATPYPREAAIHHLFEVQAARTPDAIALVYGDAALTYRELNERANRLAHHLQKLGVGPDHLVGICVERSLEMVVGMLGILKAGGAYVPLDPNYPQERLAYMMRDANVSVLVAHEHLLGNLPTHLVQVVLLDEADTAFANESLENGAVDVTGENLAYVMYTSGSTGMPKGVVIPQHGVVRLVKETNYMKFDSHHVFIQNAPIAFDAATLEIWGALLNGAKLVIPPAGRLSLEELGDVLLRHRVTTMFLTTALFNQMVEGHFESFRYMRQLLSGGEVVSILHVKKVLQQLPGCVFIHCYGPTESTTFTTCHPLTDVSQVGATVSIGRPIANTQVYVLDAQKQPVPIGVPGELYIAGDGLARGYLNQPELTAERFVHNPFAGDEQAKMYKTGDLVRYLPDGTLEFLDRIDWQVKIRGFRIEPGEIENVLSQHPSVRETIVVPSELNGSKLLVAYVVIDAHQAQPDAADLRLYLKDKLPDYMVPAAFVVLDAMPLTQNGKVDRRALPVPDRNSLPRKEYVAPRTPVEELLAAVFAEVLELEQVGIHDNFFDLGGHSLLATQVVSRIRNACQVELPLRTLFEAGTVAELAMATEFAQQTQLSSGDAELRSADEPRMVALSREEYRLQQNGGVSNDSFADETYAFPLSFAQQRLWFLEQYMPGNTSYNIPVAVRLQGALNVSALEESLGETVRRHEALRTTFAIVEGLPKQIVEPSMSLQLPVIDLREFAAEEREERAMQLAMEEAKVPFDLTRGPLIRSTLLRVAEQEHLLLLTMHHIVSDGWSMGVFINEIAALYEAYATGQQPTLPFLPLQYADFAVWQKQWLEGGVLEQQMSYWKQKLAGNLPVLQLPTDRTRPTLQNFVGAKMPIRFGAEITQALKELCNQEGVTLYMTLLATFKTLLYRYTGQEDLLVGSPIANRIREEIEGLIGFFVNTLVLRTDMSGGLTFRDLLTRVRDVSLEAYAHQDVPFEKLVEELQPERDLSHTPLFQVLFTMQNAPMKKLELANVAAEVLDLNYGISKFDLALTAQETETGLDCVYTYNPNLFDGETVERMARHFERILQHVLGDPNIPIAHISLLDEAERTTLLGTPLQLATPQVPTIHAALEQQAACTPQAIAVTDGHTTLTFEQLNRQANRLARRLRQAGVGADEPVGLYLHRSADLIVGMFGILKAGGAFLPLDPALPSERLSVMRNQAGVKVVVTQSDLQKEVAGHPITTIVLEEERDSEIAEDNLNLPIEGHHLAYVLFTSGSTGKPKGVMIEHRSVMHLGHSLQEQIYREHGDLRKVGVNAPFTFDSSVKQWIQVVFGHTLCIVPDDARRDPVQWLRFVAEHSIQLIDCTPSQFEMLLEAGVAEAQRDVPSVVLLGGEAITPAQWQRLASIDHMAFYNMYGPTECTVNATACRIEGLDEKPTLGHPLPHVRIYVLDENHEPVPQGVIGEMFIGGGGVARGYIADDELTRQSFVVDRFAEAGDQRMYKTGDLARRGQDGRIEYVGRRDHQVKIRGLRVELDEISGILEAHPAVRSAITLLHQQGNLTILTSYVVAETGQTPEEHDLQTYLSAKLPGYMVPKQYVLLEKMPMTPNGKVDRKALPVPVLQVKGRTVRTPVEELLADIFADVLQQQDVGVEDDFFHLGGHSLLATQVISRIRSTFDLELPVRRLFEHPTVEALGALIEAELLAGRARQMPPIRAVDRGGEIPLSFAQQRLWFLHRLDPNSPHFNMPLALRFRGILDLAALERSLLAVIRRHESLRTVFVEGADGQVVQRLIEVDRVPFEEIVLRELPAEEREQEVQRLLTEASRFAFQLSEGPLLRVKRLQVDDTDTVLLLTFHHIISDGWSNGVILREWLALYEAELSGTKLELPELAIQYGDFALWQQEWLQGEMLDEQLQYWTTRLTGAPPLLELPTDHPRAPVQTYQGASVTTTMPIELAERLQALSRRQGTTMYMTLLAAFGAILYRYTGQDDILIGTPIAGRNRAEIENVIGFFVNTLVMRTDLSGNPTFRQLLGRVREMTLEAYAHQDLPFEKLVEALQPERTLNYNPVYQVAFTYQQNLETQLQVAGVEVEPYELELTTSKLDLTMGLLQDTTGLTAVIEYSTDLFDEATMTRMLNHFVNLLEAVSRDEEQPISRLPLLSAEEREQVLQIGETTQTADWPDVLVHRLFEQHAAQDPDHLALIFEEQELTYRELNERANRLAHHLQALGAKPHDLIGFCLERSPEMIVAILAVLKAGGVYVPLDPEVPTERLVFMIEDAELKWLITMEKQLTVLPTQTAQVILLDRDQHLIAAQAADNLLTTVHPDDPAYMIFTSGSTGRPNGVLVRHRGVPNVSLAAIREWGITKQTRVGQFATISFDASVYQVWMAYLAGATLCVVSRRAQLSVEAFAEFVRRSGMEVADLPPVLLDQLLPEEVPTLQTVATGGERCPLKVAEKWSQRNFYNVYGPTEATVAAAWYRVPGVDENTRNIPIGRAISHTHLYILDAEQQPVPLGVPGELYIGGVGLAIGYYKRPELTAKRFVPHPFATEENARLYKTGDLVRFRSDGNIEYLGRTDNQVKVRGFRIELEEIEVLLNHHPDVQEAVVITRDDQLGSKQLVAYMVFAPNVSTSTEQIRTYLKQKLPHYMVPTAFVLMDELPRLPNRKVNRHVLPAPTSRRAGTDDDFVAPRTPDEQLLASIWAELLQLPETEISLHESFFEKGGHSLLATHLISRIRQAFAVELPLLAVFEAPTLAGLLQAILAAKLEAGHADLLDELDGLSEEEIERLLEAELADLN